MARGELKKLASLFDKYKERLVAPEATIINAFLEVVEDLLQLRLKREQVRYTPATKTLSLRAGGPLKSEIKMHESDILLHLAGRLGKNAPKKII